MVEIDHYSDIDIQICSDLLTKIGIQKEKALIITGSVAAGKSTLAKELGRRLPIQVLGIKTTTVLTSDWAGFSRHHRKKNLQSDMKTWFRDFRIYDMLIKIITRNILVRNQSRCVMHIRDRKSVV